MHARAESQVDMIAYLPVLLACSAVLYSLYRRHARTSIADIPGPQPQSFWLGNLRELFQSQVGEPDFDWEKQFGGVARVRGPFGEDRLWISDPKALRYILQTSGYAFSKQPERRAITRLISDNGLLWADGDIHARHKRVMRPAFGLPESKAFFPIFSRCAESVTLKWRDILYNTPEHSSVMNIPIWLARAALDAVGEAAFNVKFGVMENDDNELIEGYRSLLADSFGAPSDAKLIAQGVSQLMPERVLDFLFDHLPGAGLKRARANRAVAHKVAKGLLATKSEALWHGEGSRDVMSILVKANTSQNKHERLSDHEMRSQMRTLLFAGHETTSSTLSWALSELAKNPDMQTRLRREIHAKEAAIRAQRRTQLTPADVEAMPYMQAFIKEVLRFYPVSYYNYRQSTHDDVLPLSKPLVTTSGKVIDEIPIPKGLKIVVSIYGYNRNEVLWGEDAQIFDPERWLREQPKRTVPLGMYNNLLTFSAGVRSCIGWRFALYEMQAFLVELVSNFEFSLTEDYKRLRKERCLVMVPTLEGEMGKGVQMPLRVSLARRD